MPLSAATAQGIWDGFQGSGFPVAFHVLAMGLGAIVVWNGIRSIERANVVLIPALLLIVLVSLARSLTLNGASEGIRFLFTPDWSTLAQPRNWLEALTQNAWDTGAILGAEMSKAEVLEVMKTSGPAFAVIRHGARRFRIEAIDKQPDDWNAGPLWDVAMRFVIPSLAAVLLGWWLYQAAFVYAPD